MTITLNDATEQLLQEKLAGGQYADANELIAHALMQLHEPPSAEEMQQAEDWLLRNRDAIRQGIEESVADFEAGRTYSDEEVKAHFAALFRDSAA